MANDPPLSEHDGRVESSAMPSVHTLMLVFAVLTFSALILVAFLYILRKRRASHTEGQDLPIYHKQNSHRRRPMRLTSPRSTKPQPSHVYDEKRSLIENSSGPPDNAVPEIRITLPDEEDQRRPGRNSRVVVVSISDGGSVGMEPLPETDLPPYHLTGSERLQSIDLERIGGLKEKAEPSRRS